MPACPIFLLNPDEHDEVLAVMNTTVKILTAAGLLLSFGLAYANTDSNEQELPATEHQEETLELNRAGDYWPTYQFTRKGAGQAAVMPVTPHQAEVLEIQNVRSDASWNEDKAQQMS